MEISVCMATFNGEPYITDQLSSIFPQLGTEDEIVISDDNSTDKTVDIIKGFNDRRIRLYINEFRNPIFNFEFALRKCQGDVIFLSDQDDLWNTNKVKIVSGLLKEYDMVVTDCEVVDGNGVTIHDSFFKLRNSGRGLIKNFIRNSYVGCCMAMKRKIVEKALPFPKSISMHDIWIGMIAELYGMTYFCDQKLVKYRRHGGNNTCATEESPYSLYKKMSWRLNLGMSLLAKHLRNRAKNNSHFSLD